MTALLHKSKVDLRPRSNTQEQLKQPSPKQPRQHRASTWVKLLKLPSFLSFDKALLLCQQSKEKWVAWIPDHSEIVLHTSHFY